MRLISRSKIHIAVDRQRQEFDPTHIFDLADSMEKVGLMHPPVVRAVPNTDVLSLVAGENRIKAMEMLWELDRSFSYEGEPIPRGLVPYSLLGDLDELLVEEAELDENLKRKDLTWQERAAAVKRLDILRRKQRGEAHSTTALALELTGQTEGSYRETVRRELLLANHLANPLVAKAKTADEAFKLLKAEERKQDYVARGNAFDLQSVKTKHRLVQDECLRWMEQAIAAGDLYDVILTDPPYGMGADMFGNSGGRMSTIEHEYADDIAGWKPLMTRWAELSYFVAADRAHAYVFCDIEQFGQLKLFMQLAGWYVFRTPLIYYKTDNGRVPLPDKGPRRQYEVILYAIKGGKTVTNIFPDVISAAGDKNLGHGAQKPVACYQNLLQRSCMPGDRVLDTFCGTGTIFAAATNVKAIATGIELSSEYFGIAAKRLEELAQ